jgi:hypothetical protein
MPVAEPCIQDITGQGKLYRCVAVMHARTDQAMSMATGRAAWLQVSGDDDMKVQRRRSYVRERDGPLNCLPFLGHGNRGSRDGRQFTALRRRPFFSIF